MTYDDLIDELQPSFQHSISREIVERQLVGHTWNIFSPIDEFVHETWELVQSALPGLIGQWQDRIKSCVTQALPPAWEQIMSSSNKSCHEIVEWVRSQTMKIKNLPQDKWEDWVKEEYKQSMNGVKTESSVGSKSPAMSQQPALKCHWCNGNHRGFQCGWKQQQEANQRPNYLPPRFPAPTNSNWRSSNQNNASGNFQANSGTSNRGSYNSGIGQGGYDNSRNNGQFNN